MSEGEEDMNDYITSQRANQSVESEDEGQSSNSVILTEIRNLSGSFRSISAKVDKLSETVYGQKAKKKPAEPGPRSWADDDSLASSRPLPQWSDDEEVDGRDSVGDSESRAIVKLSEHNTKLASTWFSSTMSNGERRRVRESFPTPDLAQTRCPKLDPVFKTSLKTEVKSSDAELARLQAFVLDPVGPLLHTLQGLQERENFPVEEAEEAIKAALRLIGNASGQITKTRRKRALKSVNTKLQDMAEEVPIICPASVRAGL